MSVNLKAVYAFAREMYPKVSTDYLLYGTAGFRGKADSLYSCMFRMGLLATLRSRFFGGSVIGVMITASHNPEPDNGIKLIDPEGEMLDKDWEGFATTLANVNDSELEGEIIKIVSKYNIDICCSSQVYIGMDNRYHSPQLLKAVEHGIISLKGYVKSFGIVTTPMMHYLVVAANSKGRYGEPTEEGYYTKLITAFENLMKIDVPSKNYKNKIIFDGANGVGALKLLQIMKRMGNTLQIDIVNRGNGKINENCGADFVKIRQRVPDGFSELQPLERCVSVDGDADRIVYFFIDIDNKFRLLDGDRIATLIASYFKEILSDCELSLKLGLVQTAYANGGSTNFIEKKLGIPVQCVPTGVKHLHEKAKEFDIGIYFEANGHGTVLFSQYAKDLINAKCLENEKVLVLKTLLNLVNECVGDAISDMFLVEFILKSKGWNVDDWINNYEDLPNIQLKVKVKDRNMIKTTDAERKCISPPGFQEEIDSIVAKFENGRSFVRPSGTEDYVRIYAEASNEQDVQTLAYKIADLTYTMCEGVGTKPSMS